MKKLHGATSRSKLVLTVTVLAMVVIIAVASLLYLDNNQIIEQPQTTEPPQPTNSVFEPTKTEGNTAETE